MAKIILHKNFTRPVDKPNRRAYDARDEHGRAARHSVAVKRTAGPPPGHEVARGHARKTKMQAANTNKLSENQIRELFASRRWAVNLNINGEPVNHSLPDPPSSSWLVCWFLRSESADAAVERFRYALTRIAAKLRIGPAVFKIVRLQRCAAPMIVEWLTALLSTGQAGPLPDGSQVSLNLGNLIVDICLEENDPDTAELVERIVNPDRKLVKHNDEPTS